MTDRERIEQLEADVLELKAKCDFLLRHAGFSEDELVDFRQRSTMPSPPPDGVEASYAGASATP